MNQGKKICRAELKSESEDKEPQQITYFLTDGTCITDGAEGEPVYGIRAEMWANDVLVDKRSVNDVSCNREYVLDLIERLSTNFVTPVTLRDVVEDYIAEF